MLVLALDTTTRAGSVALVRDGALVDVLSGDAARTHATRLPADLLTLLARQGVALSDVDLYGVAAGPGSFTGLRIGIATIQGLAFAGQKPVVAVSALEALAHSVDSAAVQDFIGVWMDAQRGEVYAELFDASSLAIVQAARVDQPGATLDAWSPDLEAGEGSRVLLIGEGALAYRSVVEARLPRASIAPVVPLLAPAIARLAARAAQQGLAGPPHAIRPLYVRRPDAELARERARQGGVVMPARRTGNANG